MDRAANNWKAEFPFETQFFLQDGLRYAYVDEGTGVRPIVAVHGNPTWSFYWRRLISHFRDRQRVLAVDHMGCGVSDKPASYAYSLQTHRDNLLRWIESLDLTDITLVVHDWGGAIGLSAAVEQPERFGRIVILNTGAFPPPYIPFRISVCRWPLIGTLAVRGLNAFARAAITMATTQQGGLNSIAAAGLLAPYDSWKNRIAIDRFVKDIPMNRRHPTYDLLEQVEQQLGRLNHLPKLMIWGMQDWCFRPECLERFLKHWPDAEVVRLNEVGHYVMEDAPETVCCKIEAFLNEHNERSA